MNKSKVMQRTEEKGLFWDHWPKHPRFVIWMHFPPSFLVCWLPGFITVFAGYPSLFSINTSMISVVDPISSGNIYCIYCLHTERKQNMNALIKTLPCDTSSCQKLHLKAKLACEQHVLGLLKWLWWKLWLLWSVSLYREVNISCFFLRYNVIWVKCVETGSGYWLSLNSFFPISQHRVIGCGSGWLCASWRAANYSKLCISTSSENIAKGTQNDNWELKVESHYFPLFKFGVSVWILIYTIY